MTTAQGMTCWVTGNASRVRADEEALEHQRAPGLLPVGEVPAMSATAAYRWTLRRRRLREHRGRHVIDFGRVTFRDWLVFQLARWRGNRCIRRHRRADAAARAQRKDSASASLQPAPTRKPRRAVPMR